LQFQSRTQWQLYNEEHTSADFSGTEARIRGFRAGNVFVGMFAFFNACLACRVSGSCYRENILNLPAPLFGEFVLQNFLIVDLFKSLIDLTLIPKATSQPLEADIFFLHQITDLWACFRLFHELSRYIPRNCNYPNTVFTELNYYLMKL
jgi:hypothetical protein